MTLLQTFTPSVPLAGVSGGAGETGATLSQYLNAIYNFGIGAGAFLAVVMIMWGGFLYITSSGIASQAEKGKQAIQMAFLGLILLFTSFVMLQTINPALLTLKFPKIDVIKSTSKLPKPVSLPGGVLPESTVGYSRGACLMYKVSSLGKIDTSTPPVCVDNVSKDACPEGAAGRTGGFLPNYQKVFYQHQSCSLEAIQTQNPVAMSSLENIGACVLTLATGNQECYDIARAYCMGPARSFQEGKKCRDIPKFAGACWWRPFGQSEWDCFNNASATGCYGIFGEKQWCGGLTTCKRLRSIKPEC